MGVEITKLIIEEKGCKRMVMAEELNDKAAMLMPEIGKRAGVQLIYVDGG